MPACDIGARARSQSKRLTCHFNAVDCLGITLYANRLFRPDPVDAGRRFAPDRTGDPVAVTVGMLQGEALMNDASGLVTFRALRAQRLELYSLSRHHQIGDDVLREVLGELDPSEVKLGAVK